MDEHHSCRSIGAVAKNSSVIVSCRSTAHFHRLRSGFVFGKCPVRISDMTPLILDKIFSAFPQCLQIITSIRPRLVAYKPLLVPYSPVTLLFDAMLPEVLSGCPRRNCTQFCLWPTGRIEEGRADSCPHVRTATGRGWLATRPDCDCAVAACVSRTDVGTTAILSSFSFAVCTE
jgi:hypothetical protein